MPNETADAPGQTGTGQTGTGQTSTGQTGTGQPGAAGETVDVLRALAHPVRWGILQRLAAEPGICACDFTEFFDVSQPTISAHLKALREAGLVTTQRRGTTICYTLASGRLAQLARRLDAMAATAPAVR
ncbi:MAG TPA: metalloregulator ArsR/SmtB family transcription factor [Streptosporangiaceae bacterium]